MTHHQYSMVPTTDFMTLNSFCFCFARPKSAGEEEEETAEGIDILYVEEGGWRGGMEERGGGEGWRGGVVLTNGEFISLSKHHVGRGEVTMDDMFLLVNVTESQHQLYCEGKMANSYMFAMC